MVCRGGAQGGRGWLNDSSFEHTTMLACLGVKVEMNCSGAGSTFYEFANMVIVPHLLPAAGPPESELPPVSTHLDHIRFGCEPSRRSGHTTDIRNNYKSSFCSRIENSR